MAKLEGTDGFSVCGWMRTELGLSGGLLFTYAIVHQFSQKGRAGQYTGGVPYLAQFLGCSLGSARKYLHTLEEMGLIECIDATRNGIPYRNYVVVSSKIPTLQKLEGYPSKIEGCTPQNLEVNNNINNNKEIEYIYTLYPSRCPINGRSTGKCAKNKKQIESLLKTKKPEELEQTIKRYLNECTKSNTYIKNFSTFLNQLPEFEEEESKYKNVEWNEIKDN